MTRARLVALVAIAALAAVVLAMLAVTATASAAEGDPTPEPTPTPGPEPMPDPVTYAEGIATQPGTWRCSDAVTTTSVTPVLLVHGTAMTATENWATSYAPYLASLGRPVCTVALPAFGTGDVQQAVTTVARAIAAIADLAGRPIDVLGHSQGAYLPRAALRISPALAADVDDVVGLAGVYERGSEHLSARCATQCVPAFHQLAHGSHLLRAISRRALPAGPSYSNIGSRDDASITPQPVANTQQGSTSVLVQDACPGRDLDGPDHALLAGDAVAATLVLDAFDQPGPVDPSRIDPATCAGEFYAGFDRDAFMTFAGNVTTRVARGRVPTEPVVACRLLADCRDLRARGRLLAATTTRVARGRVEVRATSTTSGSVALRVGSRRVVRQVSAGRAVTVSARVGHRRTRVALLTRAVGDSTWVIERRWFARRR